MKMDGRLARNPLKGALGDALHAVMCGAGHNLRMILAALRRFCAWIWLCMPPPRDVVSLCLAEIGIVQGGLLIATDDPRTEKPMVHNSAVCFRVK